MFLAHDPTLERHVALKLLHHEPTRSDLRDEAKALAALSHPGIVTVFEIGQHAGQDFIAMEYLPGRSLRELLTARTASRAELMTICARVAQAVEAAHVAGILHRDIKPENVVVADSGGIKVVDFGLARRLDHGGQVGGSAAHTTMTAIQVVEVLRRTLPPETAFGGAADTEVSAGTQTMFGTPAYMAPEVLVGEPSTPASDVFSLGVTIYECLTGRRPYPANSLVEVIAYTIEGPPPRLDDPLGGLVDRMLARDPAQRPSLAEVARALTRSPTAPAVPRARPPQRWPLIVAGVVALGAVSAGAWWLGTREHAGEPAPAPPVVAAAPAFVTTSIAVAPFSIAVPSYGVEPPHPAAIADVLARLLGEVRGARLVGVTLASDDLAAARALDAKYLVRGSIGEKGTWPTATIELVDLATDKVTPLRPIEANRMSWLLDEVTTQLAATLAPGATLVRTQNRLRAQMFYRLGAPIIDAGHFTEARPYLEQAVDADPQLFEGWYALGLVLAWMDAPEASIQQAYASARGLAPPGPKQDLVRGVGQFLAGDYPGARALLEPLEATLGATAPESRELLYYLGEANWHDGRHAAGFAYFERALQKDPRFKPATVHAWQYAVARRDVEKARYFVGLANESTEWIELALGHYDQLATTGSPARKLDALLALGTFDAPEVTRRLAIDDLDGATYRIALAAARGDRVTAAAEFAKAWSTVITPHAADQLPSILFTLEGLAEVLITAEMGAEARTLVDYLAQQAKDHPVRGAARLSVLTAALVRDPALIVTAGAPERTQRLGAAIAAGLRGDHTAAAAELRAQIADPTFSFDFPERSALLRELVALRRTQEVAAMCADTLRPPVVRPAFVPLRARCLAMAKR